MERRLALLSIALLVGACTGAEPVGAPSPSPVPVAEIREARATVEGPAVALRDAAAEVVATVEALRASPPEDPAARREVLEQALDGPLGALEDAVAEVEDLQLEGGSDAVRQAAEALAAAAQRGEQTAAAAREDVAAQLGLAAADAELARLVAAWDRPGSRHDQMERLADIAAAAAALASELEDVEPVADCLDGPTRRAEAARHVEEATRELRDHVVAYRGNTFDERRAELAEDPYGSGGPLAAGDARAIGCWRREAPVVSAAEGLDRELGRLQDALNPRPASPSPTS